MSSWEEKRIHIIENAIANNISSLKTVFDFPEWYHETEKKCKMLVFPALKAFRRRSSAFQSVSSNKPGRISQLIFLEVAKLFTEKGFDINEQDLQGNTALHLFCNRLNDDQDLEALFMLLWLGADPMIRNFYGFTAFVILIMQEAEYYYHNDQYRITLPLVQHLLYHTFDEYAEWDLDGMVLLCATLLNSRIFDEIMKTNIRKVFFRDNFPYPFLHCLGFNPVGILLTMKPHCLQVIIDKFDYVVKQLLQWSPEYLSFEFLNSSILMENFEILLNSSLRLEFTDWLRNTDVTDAIANIINWYNTEPLSVLSFACLLLSYGMDLFEEDLFALFDFYRQSGCHKHKMFKTFLYMDVIKSEQDAENEDHYRHTDLLPQILYNVTLDLPKMIQQGEFSVEYLLELLPYFAIPSTFFTGSDCEKQVQKRPQVPLLLELSRNVFRKYFIEKCGITNARKFYTLINLLPIGASQRKIITYEAKLYPDSE